jgi:hypothetical protein
MPQKQNPISTEQLEGMGRVALGYLTMIMLNIKTWEERAIEQSSVERIAWPDLFHVVAHSLKTLTRVLAGLRVYPDNMMRDIIDTRGTWAAGPAKEFLRTQLVDFGLTTEDVYRMVQLAAFQAFKPKQESALLRKTPPSSFEDAESGLLLIRDETPSTVSIQDIIWHFGLEPIDALDVTPEQVAEWNRTLHAFFAETPNVVAWHQVFSLRKRLEDEAHLFKKLLGV